MLSWRCFTSKAVRIQGTAQFKLAVGGAVNSHFSGHFKVALESEDPSGREIPSLPARAGNRRKTQWENRSAAGALNLTRCTMRSVVSQVTAVEVFLDEFPGNHHASHERLLEISRRFPPVPQASDECVTWWMDHHCRIQRSRAWQRTRRVDHAYLYARSARVARKLVARFVRAGLISQRANWRLPGRWPLRREGSELAGQRLIEDQVVDRASCCGVLFVDSQLDASQVAGARG